MAAYSTSQTVGTLTPPSSSHGGNIRGGEWDFAVPLHDENQGPDEDYKPHSQGPPYHSTASSTTWSNGASRNPSRPGTKKSSKSLKNKASQDKNLLAAPRPAFHRTESGNNSAAEHSGTDSILDLYNNSGRSTPVNMAPATKKRPTATQTAPSSNYNEDHWIHRDKLAQIESREMAEAGIHMPPQPSGRKSQSSTRRRTRGHSEATSNGAHGEEEREEYSQHYAEPAGPVYEEEDYEHYNRPRMSPIKTNIRTEPELEEPTTPEQMYAEPEQASPARSISRPGTSRIPVSKTSPGPSLRNRGQSHSRSRNNSLSFNNAAGDAVTRQRSLSVGSQVLLDDMDDGTEIPQNRRPSQPTLTSPTTSTSRRSPGGTTPTTAKAKTPSKPTPQSGGRKNSRSTSGQTKPFQPSRETPTRRPGTSGNQSRPSTSHRPEGDAPWIATMFKPDPMLPPEQQMLPTHAKRLAQEKWAQEGKAATLYDRDFNPLNDAYPEPPAKGENKSPSVEPEKPETNGNNAPWPLSPSDARGDGWNDIQQQRNRTPSPLPPQKLAPTPPPPPQFEDPRVMSTPKTEPIRIPDGEEAEKKKGCCCVVM